MNTIEINALKAFASITPTPPTSAAINAVNYLWFGTYMFTHNGGSNMDSFNLQMAAKGIEYFLQQFSTSAPPYSDQPTFNLYMELTGGSTPPAAGSLGDLAKKYTDAITAGKGIGDIQGQFAQALQSSSVPNDAHEWWGAEGDSSGTGPTKYVPAPGSLKQSDITAFIQALQAYESSPSDAKALAVGAMITTLSGELGGTSLDAYSQMLKDMINTPINPTDSTSTLLALANLGVAGEDKLASALDTLDFNSDELAKAAQMINSNEF